MMSDIQILQVVGLLTVLLYLGVMFLARAHLIAWNSIHSLEGRIESVRADVQALGRTGGPQQAVTGLTDEVEKRTRKAAGWTSRLVSTGLGRTWSGTIPPAPRPGVRSLIDTLRRTEPPRHPGRWRPLAR